MTDSNSKIFFINRSELEDRYDATFYKEGFDFSNFIRLSQIAKVSGGKRLPKGLDFSNEPTEFRYLRVGDVNWDGTLNYTSFRYLSKKVFYLLKRYEIFKNNILIAIVGATVGKVALMDIDTPERIILTENCAKITIQSSNVNSQYLAIILQSSIVQKQIQLNYIQTTLPKLGLDRVASLYIPKIPPVNIQSEIVTYFKKASLEKQQKENQANDLLASIDTYIIRELGLTLPEKTIGIESRIFTSLFSDVGGVRFDPLYFKNKGTIKSNIYPNNTLKRVASINKGQSITKDNITAGDFSVIAGGQSSPYSIDRYNFEGDVITISASGAYSGFVWYHDYPIFASDCIVLQSKNEKEVSTHFIYYVMKALQQEIYKLQQGAGQPHVYARDLEKIIIPTPPQTKQNEMLKHIKDIHNQIKKLQEDAISILENAKSEVEILILG